MKIFLVNPDDFQKRIMISGYSMRGFARKIGISSPYIIQIANGSRNPGPKIAKKIVEGLGAEYDEIFFVKSACKSDEEKTA
jgi:transcriptional regulator with XRE-family HTH domain